MHFTLLHGVRRSNEAEAFVLDEELRAIQWLITDLRNTYGVS
jgi:hypothetical protein